MTDPTFETREALEEWCRQSVRLIALKFVPNAQRQRDKIARVRTAHAHLLKGQNDG